VKKVIPLRSARLSVTNNNDVYVYDIFPTKLRNQIIYILDDCIYESVWDNIYLQYLREAGLRNLSSDDEYLDSQACIHNFLLDAPIEDALDILELSIKMSSVEYYDDLQYYQHQSITPPTEAIEELNHRMKQAAFGFGFIDLNIVKIDSQYIHKEIIQPALKLIAIKDFSGPNDEFRKAFEHYRHKRYEECIAEANKAFESTMKCICDLKGFTYDKKKDTANKLINIIFDNGYIPSYMESSFSSLRNLLSSSLPTLRNKEAGHGQGSEISAVHESYASYALNLAATNIKFLVDQLNIQ